MGVFYLVWQIEVVGYQGTPEVPGVWVLSARGGLLQQFHFAGESALPLLTG